MSEGGGDNGDMLWPHSQTPPKLSIQYATWVGPGNEAIVCPQIDKQVNRGNTCPVVVRHFLWWPREALLMVAERATSRRTPRVAHRASHTAYSTPRVAHCTSHTASFTSRTASFTPRVAHSKFYTARHAQYVLHRASQIARRTIRAPPQPRAGSDPH